MKRFKELETLGGVEVFQLTDDPSIKSNIYCEFPWCSTDSRRFVFGRLVPGRGLEFTPFDFESGEMAPLGSGSRGCCTTPQGVFFFTSKVDEQEMELVRVDLRSLVRSVVLKGDMLRQSLSESPFRQTKGTWPMASG